VNTYKDYLNKPEESANSCADINGQLWYRTSNYVKEGEDGLIYFVDRSACIIKYKGYTVSASEIEEVLQDRPVVIAACVVGYLMLKQERGSKQFFA
jgi:long-chain acyl-CoA synthetase